MCAVRADGFLTSKVSLLGGSNDCIIVFRSSLPRIVIFHPRQCFGKGHAAEHWSASSGIPRTASFSPVIRFYPKST